MHVDVWGEGAGPRVVFVHGAMTNGTSAWSKQRALAERFELVVPSRRGFIPNPPEPASDFDVDARDVTELLEGLDGASHLVGHSYGGLVAILAASRHPERVRSMTLIEPAVESLMRGHPEVEASIEQYETIRTAVGHDPRAFLLAFTALVGGDAATVPDPLPEHVRRHVELLIHDRVPWEAQIDLAPITAADVPVLVVSGGHRQMHEALCDALAAMLAPSTQRTVITGAAHLVQRTGAPFNAALETFLLAASNRE